MEIDEQNGKQESSWSKKGVKWPTTHEQQPTDFKLVGFFFFFFDPHFKLDGWEHKIYIEPLKDGEIKDTMTGYVILSSLKKGFLFFLGKRDVDKETIQIQWTLEKAEPFFMLSNILGVSGQFALILI